MGNDDVSWLILSKFDDIPVFPYHKKWWIDIILNGNKLKLPLSVLKTVNDSFSNFRKNERFVYGRFEHTDNKLRVCNKSDLTSVKPNIYIVNAVTASNRNLSQKRSVNIHVVSLQRLILILIIRISNHFRLRERFSSETLNNNELKNQSIKEEIKISCLTFSSSFPFNKFRWKRRIWYAFIWSRWLMSLLYLYCRQYSMLL